MPVLTGAHVGSLRSIRNGSSPAGAYVDGNRSGILSSQLPPSAEHWASQQSLAARLNPTHRYRDLMRGSGSVTRFRQIANWCNGHLTKISRMTFNEYNCRANDSLRPGGCSKRKSLCEPPARVSWNLPVRYERWAVTCTAPKNAFRIAEILVRNSENAETYRPSGFPCSSWHYREPGRVVPRSRLGAAKNGTRPSLNFVSAFATQT